MAYAHVWRQVYLQPQVFHWLGCGGYYVDRFLAIRVCSTMMLNAHEFSVGLFPLWEGCFAIASTVRAIYTDFSRKGRTTIMTGEGVDTPPSMEVDVKGKEKISEN